MDEKDEIIEVEVMDETIHEPGEKTVQKMKSTDHSKAINRYAYWAGLLLRFGPTIALLFLLLGFYFTIFSSQKGNEWALPIMIVFWVIAGLGVVAFIIGRLLLVRIRALMKKDPNYEKRL